MAVAQAGTTPVVGATAPQPTQPTNWPQLPAWQIQSLQNLANNGKLSGVPPQVLAVMDVAESSGQGGGINSSGYGGWFGLGSNTTYGPGKKTTTALLRGTNQASFEEQAQIAAYAFSGYLQSTHGNAVLAEQIYQTGGTTGPPSEGAKLMAQYLGGQTVSLSQSGATPGVPGSSSGSSGVQCNKLIGFSSLSINSCQTQEIAGLAIMGAGALIMVLGLGVVVAGFGGRKVSNPVAFIVGEAQGRSATKRRMALENQRNENRLAEIDARGQQRRRNEVEYDEQPF